MCIINRSKCTDLRARCMNVLPNAGMCVSYRWSTLPQRNPSRQTCSCWQYLSFKISWGSRTSPSFNWALSSGFRLSLSRYEEPGFFSASSGLTRSIVSPKLLASLSSLPFPSFQKSHGGIWIRASVPRFQPPTKWATNFGEFRRGYGPWTTPRTPIFPELGFWVWERSLVRKFP